MRETMNCYGQVTIAGMAGEGAFVVRLRVINCKFDEFL